MNNCICSLLVLPFLVAAALPAQDPAATVAATPALVLKTADTETAENLGEAFEGNDIPRLGDGEHYVMTLAEDGQLKTTIEKGDIGFMQLRANPTQLMQIFAEKVEEAQNQASAMSGLFAGQIGMTPQEASTFVSDVFSFPKQIALVNVDVKGSKQAGFDIKIDLTATSNGWFGELVAAMQPNKLGAPSLPQTDALATLQINLDAASMLRIVRPFLGMAVGNAASDKDERTKYVGLMQRWWGTMDGTLSLNFAEGQGVSVIFGLADAAKAQELVDSDDFKALRQAQAEANPMAEVEIEERALVHRDVALTRTTVEVDGAPNPLAPDGKVVTLSGIAGSFSMQVVGVAEAKALIDAALDGKIKRAPLARNGLLAATVKAAPLVDALSGGMADSNEVPQSLTFNLTKNGKTLTLTCRAAN